MRSLLIFYLFTLFAVEMEGQINDGVVLPEVVVNSRKDKFLHVLGYVREYSSLTSYTDTVFMFREKMVDYLILPEMKSKLSGWSNPRVLASKSYYRFTNDNGLDSVSDRCNYHFSWADWVGMVPSVKIIPKLLKEEHGVDTIDGKYGGTEYWTRESDRVHVDVNVINDTASRKWVPNLSYFFKDGVDFEKFKVEFDYEDVVTDYVQPTDLRRYEFDIESRGRGHRMFMFNRHDEPFFVTTRGEVHVLDKEYITKKEAKRWENIDVNAGDFVIYEPMDARELDQEVRDLISRVDNLEHDKVRIDLTPDKRLKHEVVKISVGRQVLKRVKQAFGLDNVNAERNWNKQWRHFREDNKNKKRNDDKK